MQECWKNSAINSMWMFCTHNSGLARSLQHWRKGRWTCRTLAPTLFLKPNDFCVRAKAVPRRAVVNRLEVGWDNVAHGQGGDDSFLGGHRLNGVTAWSSRFQHGLLPGPGLRKGKSFRKGCSWPPQAELSWEKQKYCEICGLYERFVCVGLLKHLQHIWTGLMKNNRKGNPFLMQPHRVKSIWKYFFSNPLLIFKRNLHF